LGVNQTPGIHYHSNDICALNSGKRNSLTSPTGIRLNLVGITLNCTSARIRAHLFTVPAYASIDVSIVDGTGSNTDQYLIGVGNVLGRGSVDCRDA